MPLWFAIPLGVLFGFFQANTHWFTSLVQRAAGILRTSWTISILLGIFSSLLLSAGMAGDALRYSMLTIISGIFVARFVFTAFGLFAEALTTMSAVAGRGRPIARAAGRRRRWHGRWCGYRRRGRCADNGYGRKADR